MNDEWGSFIGTKTWEGIAVENMTKKKTFALRVNGDIMSAVEKWAADEFRSTNGQLEWIIFQALKDAKRIRNKVNLANDQQQKENLNL